MANWKAFSLILILLFGAILSIVCIVLGIASNSEAISQCDSNLQYVHASYGIIGSLFCFVQVWLLINQSPPELEYFQLYVEGYGLKPLPGDATMYRNLARGEIPKLHFKRIEELKKRLNNAITLTSLPFSYKLLFSLCCLLSCGWGVVSIIIASLSVCSEASPIRIWSYIGGPLVILHVLLQIIVILKIRPASLNLDEVVTAYNRGIERHTRFIETKGQTWSVSCSSSSDWTSSTGSSSYSDSTSSSSEESASQAPRRKKRSDEKRAKNGAKPRPSTDAAGQTQNRSNSQSPRTGKKKSSKRTKNAEPRDEREQQPQEQRRDESIPNRDAQRSHRKNKRLKS